MEITDALRVLRLEPGPVYTAQQVQDAASRELDRYAVWRYPAGSLEQSQAAAWLPTIQLARDQVLRTLPPVPASRRRLPGWATAAIVVASVLVVGGIGAGIVVATNVVAGAIGSAVEAGELDFDGGTGAGSGDEKSFYSAGETLFSFPATMEWIDFDDEACTEFDGSCWAVEFVTQADCEHLSMDYWLYVDESDDGVMLTQGLGAVRAGEPMRTGFGSDSAAYELGAVGDLVCLDPADTAT
ncbi:MAG: hypothetical protein ABWX82_12750 [Leifsonia sp.]